MKKKLNARLGRMVTYNFYPVKNSLPRKSIPMEHLIWQQVLGKYCTLKLKMFVAKNYFK